MARCDGENTEHILTEPGTGRVRRLDQLSCAYMLEQHGAGASENGLYIRNRSKLIPLDGGVEDESRVVEFRTE